MQQFLKFKPRKEEGAARSDFKLSRKDNLQHPLITPIHTHKNSTHPNFWITENGGKNDEVIILAGLVPTNISIFLNRIPDKIMLYEHG